MSVPSFVRKADASSGAVALGASTPVGNLLMAFLLFDSAAAWNTGSDDLGNTYTQIGSEIANVAGGWKLRAYWAKNGTAGTRTFTFTVTGSPGFVDIWFAEYTGQHPTTPIDVSQTVAEAGKTADFADSRTLVYANDLFVSFMIPSAGTGSIVSPAGFTQRATRAGSSLDDKLITAAGAQSVTYHSTNFATATDFSIIQVALQPNAIVQRRSTALGGTRLGSRQVIGG